MTIRKVADGDAVGGTVTLPPSGLPSRSPSNSYWLRDPSPTLHNHRTTPSLPEEADVVVVGSGITGAFAARFLLEGTDSDSDTNPDTATDSNAGDDAGDTNSRPGAPAPGAGGGAARGEAAGRQDGAAGSGDGQRGVGGRGGGRGVDGGGALSGAGGGEEVSVGRRRKGRRVVMLEAREVCSGATGRNGGHCHPLVYGSVPEVAAFELEVFEYLEKLVRVEGVDCDWVSFSGVHAFLSKDMFELAAEAARQLQQSCPELGDHLKVVHPSDREELASLRVPSAEGAIVQKKAASLWPYKLVAFVLERLLARHPAPRFNLQTNTPATSISPDGNGWVLTTPRGKIRARQVLLATNGYTSHLLPAFSDLIVPVRSQVGAFLPPQVQATTNTTTSAAADSNNNSNPSHEHPTPPAKLTHSYVFAADPEPGDPILAPRDDFLMQRPLPTGELIYGGGRRWALGLGVGEWRDDEVEEEVAAYLRANLAPPLDLTPSSSAVQPDGENHGVEYGHAGQQQRRAGVLGPSARQELKATYEWTGVMGFSRDHHAWVGKVPESLGGGEGLWICAGYTGHGMPAAALSAREVVRHMNMVGGKEGASWAGEEEDKERRVRSRGRLPDEFVVSEERVARARGLPHLTQGWEATNFGTLITGGKTM